LKKNKDRQHPLDRAGLVSYINFFWLKPTIDKADKGELSQDSLTGVPSRDRSLISFKKLFSASKGKTGIFGIASKVYFCEFLGTMMLTILARESGRVAGVREAGQCDGRVHAGKVVPVGNINV